jgi:hypothetical protein
MSATCATQEHLHCEMQIHNMKLHSYFKLQIKLLINQGTRLDTRRCGLHKLRAKALHLLGESRINEFVMQRNIRLAVKVYAK